ncbi:hypothetical protein CB1_000552007 [Camelus ferus]|nr:hypothetical protein CB1_000552007 [Camelus ferus]
MEALTFLVFLPSQVKSSSMLTLCSQHLCGKAQRICSSTDLCSLQNHVDNLEYMHHLLGLEHRAEEQFLEHWLNPHCKPHCDRNVVYPV